MAVAVDLGVQGEIRTVSEIKKCDKYDFIENKHLFCEN